MQSIVLGYKRCLENTFYIIKKNEQKNILYEIYPSPLKERVNKVACETLACIHTNSTSELVKTPFSLLIYTLQLDRNDSTPKSY
jgi:hypothetical protein